MPDLPLTAILSHLGLPADVPPTLPGLNRLLRAWSQRIPWESASRIARHQRDGTPSDYARSPAQFFADALRLGTGGTCFESNYALRALLTALGFQSTLHFCDMENGSVPNPHCTLIVALDGARYLADVGYPVPAALPLQPAAPTVLETPIYRYEVALAQESPARWPVLRSSGDYAARIFAVQDAPVAASVFWARLLHDHEPGGLFLREVIVAKAIDERVILRYSEGKGLVRRVPGAEESVPLSEAEQADLPGMLARLFGMDARVLRAALTRTPPVGVWNAPEQ